MSNAAPDRACSWRRGLRPVGRASGLLQGAQVGRSGDIVAHRIVWSVPVLAALLSVSGAWGEVREALRNRRVVLLLTVTALLIAGNWLLYVYAVNSGHILAGSLGYYLNPLANVLLGRIVLKERLSWLQWAAVALAAAGISALAVGRSASCGSALSSA